MSRVALSCGAGCAKRRRPMYSHYSNGTSPPCLSPMKRIEVKLSLPVVAPLLDVIKELADGLRKSLAAPLAIDDIDQDFRDAWVGELLSAQNDDVHTLLALFNEDFFADGVVAFDEDN